MIGHPEVLSPGHHALTRSVGRVRVGNGLVKLVGLCLLAGVLVAGMLFPAVGAMGVVSNRASDTVDATSADLVTTDPPLVSVVTDKDNQPIAYLYQQYRVNTPSSQISDVMKAAIVAIEDHRFYAHAGVDWTGTLRALLTNQVSGSTQGASTLTQQYVKNYQVLVAGRNDKLAQDQAQAQTIARKLKEARVALQLEKKLSKDEILARYLNLVTFSGKVDGVGTAARVFFNTTADKLTIPQAALLAGVVNNPVSFNPWEHPVKAKQRRDQVIDAMVSTGKIPKDTGEAEKKTDLGVVPDPQVPGTGCVGIDPQNGFFCDYVQTYLKQAGFSTDQLQTGGYTIHTTLDQNLAKIAKASVEKNVPKNTNGIANTFAVVEPGQQDHKVLALVANRDYGVKAADGQTLSNLPASVSDPFGAGSIYKVITSTAAMEHGKAGVNTPLSNPSSARFPVPQLDPNSHAPDYSVNNLGTSYPNPISLQQGLATSPNVAFVGLQLETGMSNVLTMASRLGMRESMKTNLYGVTPDPNGSGKEATQSQTQFFQDKPSFTLGDSPLSPMELANLGATLMSGGVWCPPNPIQEVLDHNGKSVQVPRQPCEQAVSGPVANTMLTAMSKDDTGGGTTAGTAKKFNWTRPLAGKTGTDESNRSVGFLGVMPGYAVSSLVFADGSKPAGICATTPPRLATSGGGCNGFGGTVAAPPFFDTFTQYLNGKPNENLPAPDPDYLDKRDHGPIIPWVVGMNLNDGTNTIKQAGYAAVNSTEVNSTQPKGTVIGQTPAGLESKSAPITLYVSTGFMPQAAGATSPAPPTTSSAQPGG
ncbi:transglycosylase domain-containing protein [Kutzneria viridogrisea]